MKKTLRAVCVAAMVALILAGCTKQESNSENNATKEMSAEVASSEASSIESSTADSSEEVLFSIEGTRFMYQQETIDLAQHGGFFIEELVDAQAVGDYVVIRGRGYMGRSAYYFYNIRERQVEKAVLAQAFIWKEDDLITGVYAQDNYLYTFFGERFDQTHGYIVDMMFGDDEYSIICKTVPLESSDEPEESQQITEYISYPGARELRVMYNAKLSLLERLADVLPESDRIDWSVTEDYDGDGEYELFSVSWDAAGVEDPENFEDDYILYGDRARVWYVDGDYTEEIPAVDRNGFTGRVWKAKLYDGRPCACISFHESVYNRYINFYTVENGRPHYMGRLINGDVLDGIIYSGIHYGSGAVYMEEGDTYEYKNGKLELLSEDPIPRDSIFTKGATSDSASDTDPLQLFREIKTDKLTRIEYATATEDGYKQGETTDKDTMSEIRKLLSGISTRERTNMGVTDDDLNIWFFYDDKESAVFFEGDILVQGGERYDVDNLGPLKQYIRALLEGE